jgi:response regulator RpfG family c-di-GMP phosphodiesterase
MNKILVISDDKLLSQLYVTNLEVYLNAKVDLAESVDSAIKTIAKNLDFHLIISLSSIDDQNVVEELNRIFREKEIIIPIIAVGEIKLENSEVIEVRSYYSIQNIIRSAAKILGVTAKSMAEKAVPKYFPFDIDFVAKMKKAPVNLYFETIKDEKSEYNLLLNKDADSQDIIGKMKSNGVEKIYVNAFDRLQLVNSITLNLCDILTSGKLKNKEDKSSAIETSMSFVASSIVSNEISSEIVKLASSCSKIMTEVVQDTPSLKALLTLILNNKNGFIYTHSMLSAYVAAHIVKQVPWGGDSHLDKINFVLFFHDITLGPLFEKYPDYKTEENLLYANVLTEDEKDLLLNHARLSAELVTGLRKCPIGADLLIKQHHGIGNGIGFAAEFRDDISPLSKIIIVSEAFVEELMYKKDKGSGEIKVSDIILDLKERFPKHSYKKIVDTLNSLKI